MFKVAALQDGQVAKIGSCCCHEPPEDGQPADCKQFTCLSVSYVLVRGAPRALSPHRPTAERRSVHSILQHPSLYPPGCKLDSVRDSATMQDPSPNLQQGLDPHRGELSEELSRRLEAASALSAECARLNLIIENAPVLLAYLDTEHRYRFINSAYSLRFGGKVEAVLGRSVASILGEKVWAEIKPYRERVLRGETLEYEVDVALTPGKEQRMHCALNPARDADGCVVGYVVAITDVTDRKRVAEAHDLLAAIVASSDDAIISMTPDGRVTLWNAGATRLFGYTAEEMIGQTASPLGPSKVRQTVLDRINKGETVRQHETVWLTKDGRHLDISLSAAAMRDHSGKIVGVTTVVRDISQAKQTQAAIKRSQDALRDADRRKDEFLALLAHELRNPLAPLVNSVELLRPAAADNPALQRIRGMMDRQLKQLARLVDDLLDVSRISRGRFELQRAPLSLRLAVEAALETCYTPIASRGHNLAVSISSESLVVLGDFARLTQVFANLLSNSAKYTEPGGRIEVTLCRNDTDAVVTVKDTGIGIPAESIHLVFDMFSQVQAHKEHAGGGLGIGLALVRSLVEMHHGRVEVQSEGPGTGSLFTVRLPLLQGTSTAPAPDTADPHQVLKQAVRRILIADDNADAAQSLAGILRSQGHETYIAANGRQAIELAETYRPQTIFMDLGMPLLDGLQATRQIRAQPWGKSIFIAALTGWGQPGDRIRSRKAGMDIHLVKPIDLPAIAKVLLGREQDSEHDLEDDAAE
jgi:PAS domain S-box-containing protein